MRPTSRSESVDKVDVYLDTIAGRGGTNDRANALCGTATTTNHPAEIACPDLHFQLQAISTLDGVDLHGIGIVDDRTNDVGQHGGRCGSWDSIGALHRRKLGLVALRLVALGPIGHWLVGHLAARAALNSAIAPDTSSNFLTRSVG